MLHSSLSPDISRDHVYEPNMIEPFHQPLAISRRYLVGLEVPVYEHVELIVVCPDKVAWFVQHSRRVARLFVCPVNTLISHNGPSSGSVPDLVTVSSHWATSSCGSSKNVVICHVRVLQRTATSPKSR